MFSINEKVFYPHHGAGEIRSIEDKEILGEKRRYFVIHFPLTETTIMVPSDNTEELGLRYLSDAREIKRCLAIISQGQSDTDEDWKVRYKKHQDMLKSGRLGEIAEVIRNLFDRNKVKELSSTEKRLYNSAIDMVVSEIALSVSKDKEKVRDEIMSILEKRK